MIFSLFACRDTYNKYKNDNNPTTITQSVENNLVCNIQEDQSIIQEPENQKSCSLAFKPSIGFKPEIPKT